MRFAGRCVFAQLPAPVSLGEPLTAHSRPVLYDLWRIRRDGILIPRWQIHTQQPVRGHLVVGEQRVPDLGRFCIVARLLDCEDVPILMDATLLSTQGDRLVLVGYERIENNLGALVDYAQTWLLSACPEKVAG